MSEFFNGSGKPNVNASLFGLNHILWIALGIVFIVIACLVFSKYKKAGKITLYVLAGILLVIRIVKYAIFKPFIWNESWLNSIPFELCTLMSYILPFTVFFKTKKLNPFIYPLAILGGIVTMLYPDWIFNGMGLNFNKLESLIAHLILIAIPFISSAVGEFQFKIKEIYKPIVAMLVLVVYAYIANKYITPGANHMYIMASPLPIDFGPVHHMFVFALIFLVSLFLLYLPSLIRMCKKRKPKKQ